MNAQNPYLRHWKAERAAEQAQVAQGLCTARRNYHAGLGGKGSGVVIRLQVWEEGMGMNWEWGVSEEQWQEPAHHQGSQNRKWGCLTLGWR